MAERDDDIIIDLTDLLEEGKNAAGGDTAIPPTDGADESFDLGKELAMEDDISVDEIDHAVETFDIDAELSANEEAALSPEAALTEDIDAALGLAGGRTVDAGEISLEEALAEDEAAPSNEIEALLAVETTAEMPSAPGSNPADGAEDDVVTASEPLMEETAAAIPESAAAEDRAAAAAVGYLAPEAPESEPPQAPGPDSAEAVRSAMDMAALQADLPAILEGIVRPLLAEVIRSTREELPGIIEKVIKEEIDKLKKLE